MKKSKKRNVLKDNLPLIVLVLFVVFFAIYNQEKDFSGSPDVIYDLLEAEVSSVDPVEVFFESPEGIVFGRVNDQSLLGKVNQEELILNEEGLVQDMQKYVEGSYIVTLEEPPLASIVEKYVFEESQLKKTISDVSLSPSEEKDVAQIRLEEIKNSKVQEVQFAEQKIIDEKARVKNKILDDLESIRGSSVSNSEVYSGGDYKTLINGFEMKASDDEVEELRLLNPNIKFERNVIHYSLLEESSPIVQAPAMQGLGFDGTGVSIAVLDTGVDTTHPMMAGGRVVAEACFCSAPDACCPNGEFTQTGPGAAADDQGHGTHVATTAAGSEVTVDSDGDTIPDLTFRGIAPGADVIAVKVLSALGSGSTDFIIQGIEYAYDPDGDILTDDGADIISMSLGGPGEPGDDSSNAVEAAVAAGSLAVVAAGNSGPDGNPNCVAQYPEIDSICSPGTAESALTVAASCKPQDIGSYNRCDEEITSFSSRGPVIWYDGVQTNALLKPDISAPGANICAGQWGTWFEGVAECDPEREGYIAIDGTSMATPHVSGLAALLLEAHPTWTAQQLKSALVLSSQDLTLEHYKQGYGDVRVIDANTMETFFDPVSVSLGAIIPLVTTSYSRIEELTILNDGLVTKTYDVDFASPISGYTLDAFDQGVSILGQTITLAPGESKTFDVVLDIPDTSAIPYGNYFNNLVFDNVAPGSPEVFGIKTFFLIPHLIQVNYNEEYGMSLFIHDENYEFLRAVGVSPNPLGTNLILPGPGIYNLMGVFYDLDSARFKIIHKQIEAGVDSGVSFSSSDAPNEVTFEIRDENDQIPAGVKGYNIGLHREATYFYFTHTTDGVGEPLKIDFSDYPDELYNLEFNGFAREDDPIYDGGDDPIGFAINQYNTRALYTDAITSSFTFSNDPNFVTFNNNIHLNPDPFAIIAVPHYWQLPEYGYDNIAASNYPWASQLAQGPTVFDTYSPIIRPYTFVINEQSRPVYPPEDNTFYANVGSFYTFNDQFEADFRGQPVAPSILLDELHGMPLFHDHDFVEGKQSFLGYGLSSQMALYFFQGIDNYMEFWYDDTDLFWRYPPRFARNIFENGDDYIHFYMINPYQNLYDFYHSVHWDFYDTFTLYDNLDNVLCSVDQPPRGNLYFDGSAESLYTGHPCFDQSSPLPTHTNFRMETLGTYPYGGDMFNTVSNSIIADFTLEDNNPPFVEDFEMYYQDERTHTIHSGSTENKIILRVNANDNDPEVLYFSEKNPFYLSSSQVTLEYSLDGVIYNPITLSDVIDGNGRIEALLPSIPSSDYYLTFRISASDIAGNSVEYVIEVPYDYDVVDLPPPSDFDWDSVVECLADEEYEDCYDGKDNNCDGRIDFGDPLCALCDLIGQTQPCGATEEGVCEFGIQTCEQQGNNFVWSECVGYVGPDLDDTCYDGLDNDCDAEIDESEYSYVWQCVVVEDGMCEYVPHICVDDTIQDADCQSAGGPIVECDGMNRNCEASGIGDCMYLEDTFWSVDSVDVNTPVDLSVTFNAVSGLVGATVDVYKRLDDGTHELVETLSVGGFLSPDQPTTFTASFTPTEGLDTTSGGAMKYYFVTVVPGTTIAHVSPDLEVTLPICPDVDGDGYYDIISGPLQAACMGTDCDSTNPDIYAGAIEICDDGFDNECPGDPGYGLADGADPACSGFCGDGMVDDGEECDDGATVSGDGCSDICEYEQLATCTLNFESTCPDVTPECGATFIGGPGCAATGIGSCHSSGSNSYVIEDSETLSIELNGEIDALSVYFTGASGSRGLMFFYDKDGFQVDLPIVTENNCAIVPVAKSSAVFSNPVQRILVIAENGPVFMDDLSFNPGTGTVSSIVSTSPTISVEQGSQITYSLELTCNAGTCGDVIATLDPLEVN